MSDDRLSLLPPGATFHDLDVDTEATLDRTENEPRYQERGLLGKGGLGEVVEVFDRELRRSVALKRPRPPFTPDRARTLVREAQITAQIAHPNVPAVHELGIDEEDRPYFTMAKLPQETLQSALLGPLGDGHALPEWPLQRRLRVFLRIAETVAYAHSRGILHRDLKPENVILGEFGQVYVVDWGIAKIMGRPDTLDDPIESSVESATRVGRFTGTPEYASPEQLDGAGDLDVRSDVYALGALLFAMLTGHPPVLGKNPDEIRRNIREKRRQPWSGADSTLREIVDTALAEGREDRYPDARSLVRDLEAYLDGRAVSVVTENHIEQVGRWYLRQQIPVTRAQVEGVLIAGLLCGISLGLLLSLLAGASSATASLVLFPFGLIGFGLSMWLIKLTPAAGDPKGLEPEMAEKRTHMMRFGIWASAGLVVLYAAIGIACLIRG